MAKLWKSLYFQVLIAIVLGSLLGYLRPATGAAMQPLAEAFINAIKMLIAPIIFCTVVTGIAGMGDLKKVGRVGWKALLYFEVVTTIALVIGLIVARSIVPGGGIHANAETLDTKNVAKYINQAETLSTVDFLMKIIPKTFVSAFVDGEILQVLFIAVLCGIVLAHLNTKGRPMLDWLNAFSKMLFGLVEIITRAAPVAAFGAMAFTVSKFGPELLKSLGFLMLCVYLTCAVFIFGLLGLIARLHGFSLWKVLRHIREEIFIVLGTSSSESVLPRMMDKLENSGCGKSVVGIVLPSGYSFNLDGTSIYLTMAALFIAQATDTTLTLWQELGVLGILLLTSKGAAAVTGGGFITLAATLSSVHTIPVAGIALIFGVDRFMSEARAITNLIGNTVATLVVSKWEGEFDPVQGAALLAVSADPRSKEDSA